MTNWTAQQEPQDRKPRAGDTIESEAALRTLDLGGNALVVRDSGWAEYATNRTFVVAHLSGGKFVETVTFPHAVQPKPTYPVTVLWSPWDDETEVLA